MNAIKAWPADHVVAAAQAGDATAIEMLVTGSHDHVQRFARSLCSSPEDAEDAAQEALVLLYRQIGSLRATAALASWVYRIVRNECIRRSRLAMHRPFPGFGDAALAEDLAIARIASRQVVDAIAALPPEQRAVLVLRDMQGHSGAATAHMLGLSRAAMKSRLHRARHAVREALQAPGPTP